MQAAGRPRRVARCRRQRHQPAGGRRGLARPDGAAGGRGRAPAALRRLDAAQGQAAARRAASSRPRCARSARRSAPVRSVAASAPSRYPVGVTLPGVQEGHVLVDALPRRRVRGPTTRSTRSSGCRVGRGAPAAQLRRRPQRAARLRVALPAADSVMVLVRHAKAGKRSEWRGDDALRPLDPAGETQARRLAALLRLFAPTRIYSADRAALRPDVSNRWPAGLDCGCRSMPASRTRPTRRDRRQRSMTPWRRAGAAGRGASSSAARARRFPH